MEAARFSPGSIVACRGREWVVLPESASDLLMVRPLGATDDEITGILPALEQVRPAEFDPPSASRPGDHRSCRLLRDAVRLNLRASAGPFRSFGRIAVEPRSYQLVPLLMALKLDPVRLLIADDVGIGKTVEALLIARELLDRGEINRLAVLCPPHLAEWWQKQMLEMFHVNAQLVLSGTARRIENELDPGESIFDRHPIVVVSLDYVKSRARCDDFVRTCPEFVIVDEAHGCAYGEERGRQLRHELLQRLSSDGNRHLVLVTATPHSGKQNAFQSLLALLNPEFHDLPTDLSGTANQAVRRRLARHLVQRRRADIERFMDQSTEFPKRIPAEHTYQLSPEYNDLFQRVLNYCRSYVAKRSDDTGFRQRVRWWSAVGLLRVLASSPAAAAVSLRSRAQAATTGSEAEADESGRRTTMDLEDVGGEGTDVSPGADWSTEAERADRKQLEDLAQRADALRGDNDPKLLGIVPIVTRLLREGFNPILFCRFIETAEYLAAELRKRLAKGVAVESVTGLISPEDRELRVEALGDSAKRVLVCTDCLSEGTNLQHLFNAAVHYDLAWNPTLHEQREGRVDRFNQPSPEVRVLTYYGADNKIDGLVLKILITKHGKIRAALGVSIPIPVESDRVINAVMEGLLLREQGGQVFKQLHFDYAKVEVSNIEQLWETAAEQEYRSRTIFAQEALKPEEVIPEWEAVRDAIGTSGDAKRFTLAALRELGAVIEEKRGIYEFHLRSCPRELRDALQVEGGSFKAVFDPPAPEGAVWLTRSHPMVEALAGYLMDTASDPLLESVARRSGVTRTPAVTERTYLLLLRFRYHLVKRMGQKEMRTLAEECLTAAFTGDPARPQWLGDEELDRLIAAAPQGNITPDLAEHQLRAFLDGLGQLRPALEKCAGRRAEKLLAAHRRVREASRAGGRYEVEPVLPVDVIGTYVYLPGEPA